MQSAMPSHADRLAYFMRFVPPSEQVSKELSRALKQINWADV
jgi:hypothetical protein